MSPIGFSAPIQSVKAAEENHDAFEERTWRERMHVDAKGMVFLTPMALKNCLTGVAKYLAETIKGKGKATWTKHFKSGIMVPSPIELGVKAADVPKQRLFVPSDGRTGGGSRVWKNFPVLPEWKTGTIEILLLDKMLIDKPEKVEEYLGYAGQFIGLGFFRPERNGYYGRFAVEGFKIVT